MNSLAFIQQSLTSTKVFATGLLADLQDVPVARATPEGGNHAAWIITHLAYSEAQLFDVFIQGKPNRYENLGAVVGLKSAPTDRESDYPSIEEGLAMLEQVRGDVLAYLETIDEDTLDAKSHAPEEFGDSFSTVGKCFTAMIMHVAIHAGQLTVIRRSLGREPLMA